MGFFSRIKNIWELSAYHPGQPQEEYTEPGTQIAMIVKAPKKTDKVFIPRIIKDPAREIIEEQA